MSSLIINFFVFLAIFVALGINYLVIGNTYGGKFVGTLIAADVNTVTSCKTNKNGDTSCSARYYVNEIFRKDNSTNTCTIERLTPYYFKGAANNVVQNVVLYTKRTVWTVPYNAGTCYDITIRNYYNSIGWTFIGFASFMVAVCICYIFIDGIIYIYESLKNPVFLFPTNDENRIIAADADIGVAGNTCSASVPKYPEIYKYTDAIAVPFQSDTAASATVAYAITPTKKYTIQDPACIV